MEFPRPAGGLWFNVSTPNRGELGSDKNRECTVGQFLTLSNESIKEIMKLMKTEDIVKLKNTISLESDSKRSEAVIKLIESHLNSSK